MMMPSDLGFKDFCSKIWKVVVKIVIKNYKMSFEWTISVGFSLYPNHISFVNGEQTDFMVQKDHKNCSEQWMNQSKWLLSFKGTTEFLVPLKWLFLFYLT
jgi:hypothetical protein